MHLIHACCPFFVGLLGTVGACIYNLCQVRTKLGVGKKGRKPSLPVVEPLAEEYPVPVQPQIRSTQFLVEIMMVR